MHYETDEEPAAGLPAVGNPLAFISPGDTDDFSDIKVPETPQSEKLSEEQALGLHRIYFAGEDGRELWFVKEPKINALSELYHRMGEYEKLTPAQQKEPAGLIAGLNMVLPLLRRPDKTGKRRQPTLQEAGDVMDVGDIFAVLQMALPNQGKIDPSQELAEAGFDPKR